MPDQSNDIVEYRKRRRLKRFRRRLAVFVVLAVAALILALTAPLWQGLGDELALRVSVWSKGDVSGGFPLRVSASQSPRMLSLAEKPVVLTDTHLYFYDKNGTELRGMQHGYANPVMREGGRRLLLYDRGGYSLSLESPLSRTFQKTLETPIVLARVSSSDTVAVVTRTKRYSMLLTVFGEKGAPLFEWEGYQIQDIAFTGDGGCVAATLGAEGGQIKTTLQSFRFGSADVQWKQVLAGTMALSLIERDKGGFYVVGDDRTVLFDDQGASLGSYGYSGSLVAVADDGDKVALLLADEASGEQSVALLSPPSGKEESSLGITRTLDEEVSSLLLENGNVSLLADEALVLLDGSLRATRRIPLTGADSAAWLLQGTYYVLGTDGIDRLDELSAGS